MSIRRYLVLTLFSVLTLITFIAAIQGYKISMTRAEKQFDQQLIDIAHTLLAVQKSSMQTPLFTNDNDSNISNKANQMTQVSQQGSFAFQVWKNNQLVIKSDNAPGHLIIPTVFHLGKNSHFSDVNFLDKRWRVIALTNKNEVINHTEIVVIVAQPLQTQFALAQELILAAVTPMIVAIILLSFLIYIIITQGLKPLHKLRSELSKRNTNDFTPLNLQVNNTELADIVVTLNQLFLRLDAAFQRERHFAEDAAHELKTPLSVLKINVHNIAQDFSDRLTTDKTQVTSTEIRSFESVKELTHSVDRMGHVIDQILNLNRTNTAQIVQGSRGFNLSLLLQQVIAELYGDILNKKQTIELESEDSYLFAHEFSIHLLAINLISNANKYTPIGGIIKVSVKLMSEHDRSIVLCVEDSGMGIEPQEYTRIFDRFYRVGGDQHNSNVMGCGLGLTIVKHIVDVHDATIKLSSSVALGGLKVKVVFKNNQALKIEKKQEND
jgi:two-component system sensor histidine kinase QseC